MRLDTANRSFAMLAGTALLAGMLVLCGGVGCVLVALVASQIARHGTAALTSSGHSLWPAVAFIVVVGSGAAVGVWSVTRQLLASRRLVQRVRALSLQLPDALADAARRARMTGRILLVDSAEHFSFAFGALSPRVAVSRGLLDVVSPQELAAVLEHERYHVRNLDPLKVLIARALPAAFFYLPAFRGLRARYVAGRELAADRGAVEVCGRRPLAGALFKVVRGPAWPELQTAAAIGGPELLDVRVRQLESGSEPSVSGLTRAATGVSLAGALLLTGLFVAAVVAYGGAAAVAHATGMGLRPLDVAGAVLCAVPWAGGIWLGYRWLSRRTRRPLHDK